MTRRIAITWNWQGNRQAKQALERVKVAEDAGVDTAFVSEAWGTDAFTYLALLAYHTEKINLGTGVVNYYSRTPAALAQHFGTLDELSEGRMIIGLGASSANVVEHFHGVPFNPTLARMKETVEIINTLIANQPLNYKGKWFDLQRGFTMRFTPFRPHIPVYIASFRPRAIKVVAEVADGIMPRMIPSQGMKAFSDGYYNQVRAAGRDPADMTVVSSGNVVVAKDAEKARRIGAGTVAFYVARMGDFYYEQLCDMGYAEECDAIRAAWRDKGSAAAYAAVPDDLTNALGTYGTVEECRDRLAEQEEAGVNLHTVAIADAESAVEEGRIYEALLK